MDWKEKMINIGPVRLCLENDFIFQSVGHMSHMGHWETKKYSVTWWMHDMVCVHSSSWWQLSPIPAASKINRHKEKNQHNKPPKKKYFVTSIYRLMTALIWVVMFTFLYPWSPYAYINVSGSWSNEQFVKLWYKICGFTAAATLGDS